MTAVARLTPGIFSLKALLQSRGALRFYRPTPKKRPMGPGIPCVYTRVALPSATVAIHRRSKMVVTGAKNSYAALLALSVVEEEIRRIGAPVRRRGPVRLAQKQTTGQISIPPDRDGITYLVHLRALGNALDCATYLYDEETRSKGPKKNKAPPVCVLDIDGHSVSVFLRGSLVMPGVASHQEANRLADRALALVRPWILPFQTNDLAHITSSNYNRDQLMPLVNPTTRLLGAPAGDARQASTRTSPGSDELTRAIRGIIVRERALSPVAQTPIQE